MAGSTLDPDNVPANRKRNTQKGHDVASLGPSDTSDSGQDMKGPGLVDDDALHLDRGTNEDRDADRVVDADQAGLGRGMDEAEEARRKKG